jgi:hypothetical protein
MTVGTPVAGSEGFALGRVSILVAFNFSICLDHLVSTRKAGGWTLPGQVSVVTRRRMEDI